MALRKSLGRSLALLVASAVLITSCGSGGDTEAPTAPAVSDDWEQVVAAAREEGQVRLTSSMPVEEGNQLLAAFNEDYPDIKVEFTRQSTSDMIEKFETETSAGINNADVLENSLHAPFIAWAEQGLLAPADLPEAQNLAKPDYQDSGGQWFFHGLQGYGIMYNSNAVTAAEAPKTWTDLLDPKWRGRITISPPWGGGPALVWAYFLQNKLGLDDYATKFGEQRPLVAGGHGEAVDAVVRGEADVAPMLDYQSYQANVSGAPVTTFYPTDGFPVDPRVMAITANAKNPNAARVLTDWFLSEKGQKVMAETIGVHPVVNGVPLPPGMESYEGLTFETFDPVEVGEAREGLVDEWEQALGAA
jgi:iron(III) transport system substrate-binding protein